MRDAELTSLSQGPCLHSKHVPEPQRPENSPSFWGDGRETETQTGPAMCPTPMVPTGLCAFSSIPSLTPVWDQEQQDLLRRWVWAPGLPETREPPEEGEEGSDLTPHITHVPRLQQLRSHRLSRTESHRSRGVGCYSHFPEEEIEGQGM